MLCSKENAAGACDENSCEERRLERDLHLGGRRPRRRAQRRSRVAIALIGKPLSAARHRKPAHRAAQHSTETSCPRFIFGYSALRRLRLRYNIPRRERDRRLMILLETIIHHFRCSAVSQASATWPHAPSPPRR